MLKKKKKKKKSGEKEHPCLLCDLRDSHQNLYGFTNAIKLKKFSSMLFF